MTASQETLASQTAHLLSALSPEAALECERFRDALHNFLDRGGENLREEVSDWLDLGERTTKRRKIRECRPELESGARAFFLQQRRDGQPLSSAKISDMVDAVAALQMEADNLPDEAFDLAQQASSSQSIPEQCKEEGHRQRYVVQRFKQTESKTRESEIERRLWLLRVEFEVQRLQPTAFCGTTPEGVSERGIPGAEREFARLSKCSRDHVQKIRRSARTYVHISGYENGLGLIYMLGAQSRRIWERLSNKDFSCILKYSLANIEQLSRRARELQPIASRAVVGGFQDSKVGLAELRENGHIFSRHFLQPSADPVEDGAANALNALATAAKQAQSSSQSASLLEGRRDSILAPNPQFPEACAQASLAVQGLTDNASAMASNLARAAPLVQNPCCPSDEDLGLDMRPYGWHNDDSTGAWEEWLQALGTSFDFELPHQVVF